ncbi:MAG: primosomal protein N', partial [Candidatus Omnitrophica bacterium]|nr:primosomal protein N' [Candidatus Omnitrophota bacterium]
VVGTRSCVFAPAKKLKLIVIDEENDSVYKQDQVPHYHARETALMRAKIEKAKTVLASGLPSLESIYTAKKFKIEPLVFSQEMLLPEVKIADMRRGFIHKKDSILTKYLQDAIVSALESGGKILLFLNRKGFATLSYCHNCGKVLKCPRCDTNLIYHFKEQLLTCHYCNYKMRLPKFCPECNSGYIRYSGFGTEKIESELSRLFPGARIKILNERKEDPLEDADIFIATQFILKENSINFELIGVLSIDNSLNRLDLRAGEKTFALLLGLLKFCGKKMIIQTYMGEHYCFRALEHKDIDLFYKEEIKQRQQLKFPPFSHLAFVKVRGNKESRVKEASQKIFEALSAAAKNSKNISVVNLSKAYPFKLRDNFYWQVLVKSPSVLKMSAFLKKELKGLRHSGIIVTVDVDPV